MKLVKNINKKYLKKKTITKRIKIKFNRKKCREIGI